LTAAVTTPRGQPEPRRKAAHRTERTCVGCGGTASPADLVRLVCAPDGQVGVDLAGGQFGRGAWVHPSPDCLLGAPRGLARSFRGSVNVSARDLSHAIAQAAERRTWGLLSSAARARAAVVGADAVALALGKSEASVVVVATDAAAAASLGAVMAAVAEGRAVAFGTKAGLGALVARAEVAVIAITSPRLAKAIQKSVRVGNQAAQGLSQEEHASQDATTAEDR
jgi:predicted RNA-binding protein YlxR (DUF448 family)